MIIIEAIRPDTIGYILHSEVIFLFQSSCLRCPLVSLATPARALITFQIAKNSMIIKDPSISVLHIMLIYLLDPNTPNREDQRNTFSMMSKKSY